MPREPKPPPEPPPPEPPDYQHTHQSRVHQPYHLHPHQPQSQQPACLSTQHDQVHAAVTPPASPSLVTQEPRPPGGRPSSCVPRAHLEKHATARQQRPTTSQDPPPFNQGAICVHEGTCGRYRYGGSCHRRGVESGSVCADVACGGPWGPRQRRPFGRSNNADSRVAPLTEA